MISFIFKSIIYFSLSFLVLSINIENRPLFQHAYKISAPYTKKVLEVIYISGNEVFSKGKRVIKKMFVNSSPKVPQDTVNSIYSSSIGPRASDSKAQLDQYTEEEKEMIKRILKEHSN